MNLLNTQHIPRRSPDAFESASISTPKISERERYTATLKGLEGTLSETEREFLQKWGKVLPQDRWGEWMISWARTLSSYGTPLNFMDGVQNTVGSFREGGMNWPTFRRVGGNYELRRELIAKQKPYRGEVPLGNLNFRYMVGCKLCENIHQGEDAKKFPAKIPNNIMMELKNGVIAPNRYPPVPLAMLWLPKDHDDLTNRVNPIKVAGLDGKPVDEYLPQSVSEFPSGSHLTGIMEEAGLVNTSFRKMTGGIATVYIGNKPEHA